MLTHHTHHYVKSIDGVYVPSPPRTPSPTEAKSTKFNLWDRSPIELHHRILDHSDALTQFLNNHGQFSPEHLKALEMNNPHKLQPLHDAIWSAAIQQEWPGDWRTLPGSLNILPIVDWYRLVKTKETFERLLEFPQDHRRTSILKNIAYRNCWFEYLQDPRLTTDRPALVHEVTFWGHLNYTLHLHTNLNFDVSLNQWVQLGKMCAYQGLISDIRYLIRMKPECITPSTTDEAADSGDLELVKLLLELVGCTREALNNAAKSGHLNVVRYLHHHRTEGCTTDAMDLAAANGHLLVVKFLHENRNEGCTTHAMDDAAWSGRLEVLKFLHGNRHEGCTVRAMDHAASQGHLKVVEWLAENRSEGCTMHALKDAQRNGHVRVVEYIEKHQKLIK
ncbi:hypothetical protein HDV05_002692 [Chytridiales sp. JEL 0842]|nr:hypothetical protein HDV05_002692 [Chytridiales sp. JEL 0842]